MFLTDARGIIRSQKKTSGVSDPRGEFHESNFVIRFRTGMLETGLQPYGVVKGMNCYGLISGRNTP